MSLAVSLQALMAGHTLLSIVGLLSGSFVLREIFASRRTGGWAAFFLISMAATSLSGFLFPFIRLGPGWVTGALSLVVLVPTMLACAVHRLAGPWRWIYVVGATTTLYLDVVIGVLQLFAKLPALHWAGAGWMMATQALVLAAFMVMGAGGIARFHPPACTRLNQPAPI
jgi:hypothetical protein